MSIKKLDETTINKIGAGEVIQRPLNVVKELLENSLDASSDQIIISIGKGGLQSITVTDNGKGISLNDLKMLGGRYTTSKQLDGITFGYRGEALSCMTYVSKVTITSRPKTEKLGYKISFKNGQIIEQPFPTASTVGTTVVVENLFSEMLRKKSMKENDEYKMIVKLVGEYAVNNPNVSFTLRKAGMSVCEIKTDKNGNTKNVIGKIYTNSVMNTLKEYEMKNELPPFQLKLWISDSGYQVKKNTFILFVNKRLVEHNGMKKMIEKVYEEYLPKIYHFVYIDMSVVHDRIDVNVNPSKSAVRLLEEEKILGEIEKFVKEIVKEYGQSRSFLPTQMNGDFTTAKQMKAKDEFGTLFAQNKVFQNRVDSNATTIDQFLSSDNQKVFKRIKSDKSLIQQKLKDGEKLGLDDEEVVGGSQNIKKRKSIEIDSPFKLKRKTTVAKQMEIVEDENDLNNYNNNNLNNFNNYNQINDNQIELMEEENENNNYLINNNNMIYKNQMIENDNDDEIEDDENDDKSKMPKQPKSLQQLQLKYQKTLSKPTEKSNENINQNYNENNQQKKVPQIRSMKDFLQSPNETSKYSSPSNISNNSNSSNNLNILNQTQTIEKTVDGKDIISIHVVKRRPSKFIGNSLQSIKTLRLEFEVQNVNIPMIQILSKSSLVGVIDSSYCLIQSNTQLYLLHIPLLLHDLLYQQIIYSFGDFTAISINPNLSIHHILQSANITDENQIESIINTLKKHAKLLYTYFNITITDDGEITTIPDILPGYLPCSSGLAFFITQLAKVDWKSEMNCFRMISECLANYYCVLSNEMDIDNIMANVLLPYIKNLLIPQNYYDDTCLIQIADISKLYHLFERC